MTQNVNHGCIDNTLTGPFLKKFDSKRAFVSYWHQIDEVFKTSSFSILEVGVGNKFVSLYLERFGREVTTVDILRGFNPSVNSSVLNLPFKDNSFDVSLCCEVLEHLPFKNFKKSLLELKRVTASTTIISLPDATPYISINVDSYIGIFKKILDMPIIQRKHVFDGQHHWEIGKKGYLLNKIRQVISESNFNICSTYRVAENPYHRFFILRKNDSVKNESRQILKE